MSDDHEAPYTLGYPEEVARLYKPLWREASWLWAKWLQYIRLFGTSKDDLDTLNAAAGRFIFMVQNLFISDLLLTLSKLTDDPGTGQRKNLCLAALVQAIDPTVYPALRTEADAQLTKVQRKAAFARQWRNRRLAHLDLRTELGDHAEPLAGYTRRQVREALEAVAELLNILSRHFGTGATAFAHFISGPGDADSLVRVLRDGLAFQSWRRESRWAGGTGKLPDV